MYILKTLKSQRVVAFGRLSLVEEETRVESVGLSQRSFTSAASSKSTTSGQIVSSKL
jgi:hypothetical protein